MYYFIIARISVKFFHNRIGTTKTGAYYECSAKQAPAPIKAIDH